MSNKIHPFEKAGLGVGPFRMTGVISLPAPSFGEANPEAFNGAMRLAHEAAKRAGVSLGACEHCGAGLMHNAIVTDSTGKRFVVGLECAAKTGDASLGSRSKIEANRIRRKAAAEREAAKREAWLDELDEATGETNRERLDREQQERIAAQEKAEMDRKAAAAIVADRWAFWIERCAGFARPGNFVDSIIRDLEAGHAPRGRAIEICGEIFAKTFGRAGSKTNDAAFAEFEDRINQ